MLDEGIREKFIAGLGIVYLENLSERSSVDLHIQFWERLMGRVKEEQGKHFGNALIVLQSSW